MFDPNRRTNCPTDDLPIPFPPANRPAVETLRTLPERGGVLHENQPQAQAELIPGFDDEENEARTRALVDLIATGEAVALVGAGLSVRIGYDSWPRLLSTLEVRANAIREGLSIGPTTGDPREYLAIAQRIRDHIADPGTPGSRQTWYNEIGQLFARHRDTIRGSLGSIHRDIARLPFRSFLTTNVEEAIEVALEEFRPSCRRAEGVAVWNGNDRRLLSRAIRGIAAPDDAASYVLHLHGVYWSGSSLVLCADEYAEAYGIPALAGLGPKGSDGASPTSSKSPASPTHLFLLTTALLSTRRVVFVGFSLDDVYFTEVLRRVSDMLWEWQTATHFAIMPIEPGNSAERLRRAAELKRRSGIETVFYPVVDGNYGALDALIARIADDVEARRSSAAPHSISGAPVIESGAANMPEWVVRNNDAQIARLDGDED